MKKNVKHDGFWNQEANDMDLKLHCSEAQHGTAFVKLLDLKFSSQPSSFGANHRVVPVSQLRYAKVFTREFYTW
jgi:hypothetical protein